MFSQQFFYWLLFCYGFASVPASLHFPHIFGLAKFWWYLILTGCYAFLSLAWIALMSRLQNQILVVVNGVASSLLTLWQFYRVPEFSTQIMAIDAIACLLVGLILLRLAYRKWCAAEFY